MPITFPAHQGLIAWLKVRRPNRIDGTALCIGAAAPDVFYALGSWANAQSHTLTGAVVLALPFTLIMTALVRWRAASGIGAQLPDLGRLRLRSFRVLALGRPPALRTLLSAAIGIASHVWIDAFTHQTRWGATWLGLDRKLGAPAPFDSFTIARAMQYTGHIGGSIVFAFLLYLIARDRRLDDWYGASAVIEMRHYRPSVRERILFWALLLGPPLAAFWFALKTGRSLIFLTLSALAFSVVLAGSAVSPGSPLPKPPPGGREPYGR